MGCGCKELLEEVKQSVLDEQSIIEDALKEDGPFWARIAKGNVIKDITDLFKENDSFSKCNCDNAEILLNVEKLVKVWESSEKLDEIRSRIQKDEVFHYLEQLVGLSRSKDPPKMRILDLTKKRIEEI